MFIIFFLSTPLVLAISLRKVKAIYAASESYLTVVAAVAEGCVAQKGPGERRRPPCRHAYWGGPGKANNKRPSSLAA